MISVASVQINASNLEQGEQCEIIICMFSEIQKSIDLG